MVALQTLCFVLMTSLSTSVRVPSQAIGQEGKPTVIGHPALPGSGSGYQAGSPWPKFRQNNAGTSISAFGGCDGLPRWKVNLGSPTFLSSPAIDATGNVYIGTENGELFSLSAAGAINWKYSTAGPIWSSPAIGADGTIYVGSNDDHLYAISSSGTKTWAFATGDQVVSSPAIWTDGTIYFGSWDGNVYALNSNGSLKWKYPTKGAIQSSPAIGSDGTVYIGSDDGNLYALSTTGTLKWSFATKGPVQSSPAIGANGTIYIGSASEVGDFYALSATGSKNWEYDVVTDTDPSIGGAITASPAIGQDGTIFIASDEFMVALNANGTLRWTWGAALMRAAAAISSDMYAFFPENGNLMQTAFSLNGGSNYYSQNFIMSSPAIGEDGTVYFGGGDGYFYAVGNQVNTVPLSSVSASPAAVTGGTTSTGTVTLTADPPIGGGDVVAVSSSNTAVASLISPVFVQWGGNSATFTITTVPVATNTSVTLSASSGGITQTTTLTVNAPIPSSLSLVPNSVTGSSTTSVTGYVTMSGNAPPGGINVALSSSNPSAASVPTTVFIPGGASLGNFTISHSKVTATTKVTISATYSGATANAILTVNAG